MRNLLLRSCLGPRRFPQNTSLQTPRKLRRKLGMTFWRIQNGGQNMSELVDQLRTEFQDEEYRHAYADDCLDTMIATQIKVLREQRGMTQGELAVAAGMKQPRIPLLEDATYSNWSINTLKRFAKAFDVALSVKFETFSRVVSDLENLSRESLQRPTFANDPQFQRRRSTPFHRFRRRRRFQARRQVLQVPLSV